MQGNAFLYVSLAILALGSALYGIGPMLERWDWQLKDALRRLESERHPGQAQSADD